MGVLLWQILLSLVPFYFCGPCAFLRQSRLLQRLCVQPLFVYFVYFVVNNVYPEPGETPAQIL